MKYAKDAARRRGGVINAEVARRVCQSLCGEPFSTSSAAVKNFLPKVLGGGRSCCVIVKDAVVFPGLAGSHGAAQEDAGQIAGVRTAAESFIVWRLLCPNLQGAAAATPHPPQQPSRRSRPSPLAERTRTSHIFLIKVPLIPFTFAVKVARKHSRSGSTPKVTRRPADYPPPEPPSVNHFLHCIDSHS